MTVDISAFGLKVVLTASETFPSGITLTQFPDDVNPVDSPAIQLRDVASGLNGDMVVWSKANPVPLTIAVLPNTEDDRNLSILASANRAAAGRFPAQDEINVTVTYPDGTVTRFVRGVVTDGILGRPVASSGRITTKPYTFKFEDIAQ
jgi:hypothetical protein